MNYADRMRRLLNQKVTWAAITGHNAYNKPTMAPPETIPARKERRVRLVRNNLGEEVVSNTTVYCQKPIQPQEELDGAIVLSVADWVDGAGNVVGCEVYL